MKNKDLLIELTNSLEPCSLCGHKPMVSFHGTIRPNIYRVNVVCSNDHCAFGINQFVDLHKDIGVIIYDVTSAWHDSCIELKEVKELIDF